MQLDHPEVRASVVCPLCLGPKDTGLICCWSCYRSKELRYGNPEAEQSLNEAEFELAAAKMGVLHEPGNS